MRTAVEVAVGDGEAPLPVTRTLSNCVGLFAAKPMAPAEKVVSLADSTRVPSTEAVSAVPLAVTVTVCQAVDMLKLVEAIVDDEPFTTLVNSRWLPLV